MEEVRAILSKGVPELIQGNPGNFFRTSDQVVENLDVLFREHQKQILAARERSLNCMGSMSARASPLGESQLRRPLRRIQPAGVAAGLLGVAGLPNLREIKTRFKALREEEQRLRASPMGILFKQLV